MRDRELAKDWMVTFFFSTIPIVSAALIVPVETTLILRALDACAIFAYAVFLWALDSGILHARVNPDEPTRFVRFTAKAIAAVGVWEGLLYARLLWADEDASSIMSDWLFLGGAIAALATISGFVIPLHRRLFIQNHRHDAELRAKMKEVESRERAAQARASEAAPSKTTMGPREVKL